eukprot:gene5941-6180_t
MLEQDCGTGCLEVAKLLIDGEPEFVYVAEETPNVSYLNSHHVINNLRDEAKQKGGQGPRVVVAGPTDAGKSTLCRMLLNWAAPLVYYFGHTAPDKQDQLYRVSAMTNHLTAVLLHHLCTASGCG